VIGRLLGLEECESRRLAPRWLRRWWWQRVRGYGCEICVDCGGPVGLVWTAPDHLWRALGLPDWMVLCVHCFDRRFYRWQMRRVSDRAILRWVPRAEDPAYEGRADDLGGVEPFRTEQLRAALRVLDEHGALPYMARIKDYVPEGATGEERERGREALAAADEEADRRNLTMVRDALEVALRG
jgi:hypothetical protein